MTTSATAPRVAIIDKTIIAMDRDHPAEHDVGRFNAVHLVAQAPCCEIADKLVHLFKEGDRILSALSSEQNIIIGGSADRPLKKRYGAFADVFSKLLLAERMIMFCWR